MRVKCSINSVRGFIKQFLGIRPTPYWFHQTLTFSKKIKDELTAKSSLKKLLDSLEKAYPEMAAFFIQGFQKEAGIHYHVIFLFWGELEKSPEKMRETFGGDVFFRWNKINDNSLNRNANLMRLQKKDSRCIEYLLGHVWPEKHLPRSKSIWHGVRNRKLIQANVVNFTKKQVREIYEDNFPIYGNWHRFEGASTPIEGPVSERMTMRELIKLKDYIDYDSEKGSCGINWETFKKRELNTKDKVSNDDFLRFKNKKRTEIINKYQFNSGDLF